MNISAKVIDGFDGIVTSYGIWKQVYAWKDLPRNENDTVFAPNDLSGVLEVLWVFCVNVFGDYGTSPRSGWIEAENYTDFCDFIDKITEGSRLFAEEQSV